MATEIKYGIVIDNKDIHETGKIRVMLVEEIPSGFRNKSIGELKTLLSNLDKTGDYIAWQKSTASKKADPYLTEPFLPKVINQIPEEGQLVKIVIYTDAMFREYVGPQLSSLDNQKEGYVNSLNAFKTQSKKDLISRGLVNKVNDFSLYGQNSQVILSDREVFLRTNHQDQSTKTKNPKFTLYQQSTFGRSMSFDREVKEVTYQPEVQLSHLMEVSYTKKRRSVLNEKTVVATIKLLNVTALKRSDGKLGMTNRTYQYDKTYQDAVLDLEMEFTTDDVAELERFIEETRLNFLNKRLSDLATLKADGGVYTTTVTNDKFTLIINDHRFMTQGGGVITDRKELEIGAFIVRLAPDQPQFKTDTDALESLGIAAQYKTTDPKFYFRERDNLIKLNTLTNRYYSNTVVESKLQNLAPRTNKETVDVVKLEETKDSYSVQAADKILLLSTQASLKPFTLSNRVDQYGLTQEELSRLTDVKNKDMQTFSTVRGERLVEILNRLITLMLNHGHATGVPPKESLEAQTREELIKLQSELNAAVNKNLSGGPDLLNQYVRVN